MPTYHNTSTRSRLALGYRAAPYPLDVHPEACNSKHYLLLVCPSCTDASVAPCTPPPSPTPLSSAEREAFQACTMLDIESAALATDLLRHSDPLIQEFTRSLATAHLMPQHLPFLPRGQGSESWSVAEYLWSVSVGAPVPMSLTSLCSRVSHLTYIFTQERGSHASVAEAVAAAPPLKPEYHDVPGYVHGYHSLVDAPPHLVDYDRKIPLFNLSKFPLHTWASYFIDQCPECARFFTPRRGPSRQGCPTTTTTSAPTPTSCVG
jgi:hypothetical protein